MIDPLAENRLKERMSELRWLKDTNRSFLKQVVRRQMAKQTSYITNLI